jgi:hypothetical protein
MPHVEHRQTEAIGHIFRGELWTLDQETVSAENKTPNQLALAAAVALGYERIRKDGTIDSRNAARAQAADVFTRMAHYGHQCTSMATPDKATGSEAGCPEPHSELWNLAMLTILRESALVNPSLLVLAVTYYADHVAMCRAFWTQRGVRIPGSRALQSPGMDFRPVWSTDSWIYALISNLPTDGLDKPPRLTLDILRDEPCKRQWLDIYKMSLGVNPKLAIPVHKWNSPTGGFVAALEPPDKQMNDRLSWVSVDGSGDITGASDTLADFKQPPGKPDLVFGGESDAPTVAPAPSTPPITVENPPAVPTPAPSAPGPQKGKKENPFTGWL